MAPSWRVLSNFTLSLAALIFIQPRLIAAQCDIPPLTLTWSNITVTQDGLGVARGIELGIGTPHQIFAFRPSTTLNNTRVNNVINCGSASNDSCIGGLGGAFDAPKSTSYAVSIKSQWNGSQIDAEDSTGAYVYFNDDVAFQENGNVDGFPLVMDSEVWGGGQSGLPLGTNSSFLRAAVAGGVAPSQVFGLWSGSRGIDPHDGLLVVGGYDRARVDPASDFTTFPIGEWNLERACPLQVTVTNLTYQDIPLIPDGTDGLIACIEPSTQRFVFPPAIAQAFGNSTDQNETAYPGKMQYNVSNRPGGDLVVTLAGGYQSRIPNKELFAPLRGSDEYGRYAITNDSTLEAFVSDTRQDDPGDVDSTLGGLFLTFNYLLVDYAKSEFQLAPAVAADAENVSPNPTTICTPTNLTPASPTPAAEKKATSKGAIAGGVVGGVAGLALLGAMGFLLFRRNRRAKNPAVSEIDGQTIEPVSRQPSEMMAHEVTPVHEMSASRYASFRKPEGRGWH
ncbi:aspartic peptidase domain-containing protein [Alternaria rosae]|uniref:aspartic peptidase domain-containing protein n=1 Tax=Alternaria rosae TaxID=1187941 RepID=UPI001E8D84F6|nr:aspartic peptidase domain-containing protein [Alternaria rosae]KAH6882008.1 aspartic peptidase domain-containing protein [Alternaria rosae]